MSNIKIPAWSFSSIKTFDQCPKKFYHLKVAKDFQEDQNADHLIYGTRFHEAAEFYIRDDKPLPHEFHYAKASLDRLKAFPGEKLCEYEMGITKDLQPCSFNERSRWVRGIADLLIVDGDQAYIVDYKTGKSAKYADTKQLALLAAAVFLEFPYVKTIKAMLLFVVSNEIVKEDYTYEKGLEIFDTLAPVLAQRSVAYETGVFNPIPNGLCKKWCSATKCIHNGNYKGD